MPLRGKKKNSASTCRKNEQREAPVAPGVIMAAQKPFKAGQVSKEISDDFKLVDSFYSNEQSKITTLLLKQNDLLEREIKRLNGELDEATKGILKRGYLYKHRDREIAFASKWGLRYFQLQGNVISYYADDREHHPKRTINLTGCLIKDEGLKGNYRIFNIFWPSIDNQAGSILLRLSTISVEDGRQWIFMLQQACLISQPRNSDNHSVSKNQITDLDSSLIMENPIDLEPTDNCSNDLKSDSTSETMRRVRSSQLVLQRSQSRKLSMSAAVEGTASFTSALPARLAAVKEPIEFKQSEGKSSKAPPPLVRFPAVRPVHVVSGASPLSSDGRPAEQNYRGFFNLGVMVLFISNFRMVVDNLSKYGLLAFRYGPSAGPLEGVDLAVGSYLASLLLALCMERSAAAGWLSEGFARAAAVLQAVINIVLPCVWVMTTDTSPTASLLYLFQAVVIWMKLISYAHVNCELRSQRRESRGEDSGGQPVPRQEVQDSEGRLPYPHNLTAGNLLWFVAAPTLCYQLDYPRSPRIRRSYVLGCVLRLVLCATVMLFVTEQYVAPILQQEPLSGEPLTVMTKLLKLSIPNTYLWLLGFYAYFHLWLNLTAELTRFGDRRFYKDWWNSRTIDAYWRSWNLPVHHWMLRHLYHPLLSVGANKTAATYAVFVFSAFFHELVISAPFRLMSGHAFLGMLFQAPLIRISKWLDGRTENAFLGNALFWLVFCLCGQPMGVLLYCADLSRKSCSV